MTSYSESVILIFRVSTSPLTPAVPVLRLGWVGNAVRRAGQAGSQKEGLHLGSSRRRAMGKGRAGRRSEGRRAAAPVLALCLRFRTNLKKNAPSVTLTRSSALAYLAYFSELTYSISFVFLASFAQLRALILDHLV
jgi:hypothetical protein